MKRLLDGRFELEFGLLWFFDPEDTAADPARLVPPATLVLSGQGGVIAAQHIVDGAVRVMVDLGSGGVPAGLEAEIGSGVIRLPSGRLVLTGDGAAATRSDVSLAAGTYFVTVRGNAPVDPDVLHMELKPRRP